MTFTRTTITRGEDHRPAAKRESPPPPVSTTSEADKRFALPALDDVTGQAEYYGRKYPDDSPARSAAVGGYHVGFRASERLARTKEIALIKRANAAILRCVDLEQRLEQRNARLASHETPLTGGGARALAVVVLCVAMAQCAGSGPAAPSMLRANLVPEGSLRLTTCVRGSCSYAGWARNLGGGCAVAVSGVTRTTWKGVPRTGSEWSLGPYRKIRPGEVFEYLDCCLGLPDVGSVTASAFHTEIFWDDVQC
jgi:hypothetical protein